MELTVEKLCKAYGGAPVLQEVSFTAREGVTAVLASSGAGKTTLLRILMGLEQPDSGRVRGLENARLAAVFQEDRLLPEFGAAGNLRLILGEAWDADTARTLLRQLGLPDTGAQPVREYSGGMRRRLALARALLAPSDALFLDEPFTGLDQGSRTRAAQCIREYAAGKLVVLAAHDPDGAAGLSARCLPLERMKTE